MVRRDRGRDDQAGANITTATRGRSSWARWTGFRTRRALPAQPRTSRGSVEGTTGGEDHGERRRLPRAGPGWPAHQQTGQSQGEDLRTRRQVNGNDANCHPCSQERVKENPPETEPQNNIERPKIRVTGKERRGLQ